MQADLLIFTDFAEVGDAYCQVSERPVCYYKAEVFFVEPLNDIEGLISDALYEESVSRNDLADWRNAETHL